jgi:hypothetical protein
LPGLRSYRVQRISGTPRIPAAASADPFSERSEVFSDLYTSVPSAMAGAEGFEVSFPSGHYAIFFVEFNSQTALYQEPAGIPKLVPVSQLSRQWTTFRKNLVSLVSLLLSIVQFGRERTGDVPVDSNATIPGPCWHRLRQCGRCTSNWHSGP